MLSSMSELTDLSNNIVGSMVLSILENIVCHFLMYLYRLWVIFDKLPRFLNKRHRHFLSCSSQLKIREKNMARDPSEKISNNYFFSNYFLSKLEGGGEIA